MKAREHYIQMLNEIQTEIEAIEQQLSAVNGYTIKEIAALTKIKLKKLCVENQLSSNLPIVIEGFLGGEVTEEVERDERGSIRETYYYLGCPNLTQNIYQPNIMYNKFGDVTEILQHNTGKFLKVTIEAVPLGESETCAKCDKRFQCLTTKVRG